MAKEIFIIKTKHLMCTYVYVVHLYTKYFVALSLIGLWCDYADDHDDADEPSHSIHI